MANSIQAEVIPAARVVTARSTARWDGRDTRVRRLCRPDQERVGLRRQTASCREASANSRGISIRSDTTYATGSAAERDRVRDQQTPSSGAQFGVSSIPRLTIRSASQHPGSIPRTDRQFRSRISFISASNAKTFRHAQPGNAAGPRRAARSDPAPRRQQQGI